ncbi:MAG: hypothetical protein ACYDGS_05900 [Thermoleophilia bacterium]
MTKILKLTVTVLIIAIVAFIFSGCGDSEAPATTPTKTSKTTKPGSGSASTGKAEELIGQVITPGELSPKDFKSSIESRRPIVVTFYISGPYDDNQVRSSVMSLQNKFRGQVDFYDYLYTDGQKFGDLSIILKVSTTPTVVIINKEAKVQRAWSGFVDSKSIEQGICEATAGCSGSSSGSGTGTGTGR